MTLIEAINECKKHIGFKYLAIDLDDAVYTYYNKPKYDSDKNEWVDLYSKEKFFNYSFIGQIESPLGGKPKNWLIKLSDIKV